MKNAEEIKELVNIAPELKMKREELKMKRENEEKQKAKKVDWTPSSALSVFYDEFSQECDKFLESMFLKLDTYPLSKDIERIETFFSNNNELFQKFNQIKKKHSLDGEYEKISSLCGYKISFSIPSQVSKSVDCILDSELGRIIYYKSIFHLKLYKNFDINEKLTNYQLVVTPTYGTGKFSYFTSDLSVFYEIIHILCFNIKSMMPKDSLISLKCSSHGGTTDIFEFSKDVSYRVGKECEYINLIPRSAMFKFYDVLADYRQEAFSFKLDEYSIVSGKLFDSIYSNFKNSTVENFCKNIPFSSLLCKIYESVDVNCQASKKDPWLIGLQKKVLSDSWLIDLDFGIKTLHD